MRINWRSFIESGSSSVDNKKGRDILRWHWHNHRLRIFCIISLFEFESEPFDHNLSQSCTSFQACNVRGFFKIRANTQRTYKLKYLRWYEFQNRSENTERKSDHDQDRKTRWVPSFFFKLEINCRWFRKLFFISRNLLLIF